MVYNVMSCLDNSAGAYPDQIAAADGQTALTYGQLLDQARRIGTALAGRLGGARGGPVFVCIGRWVECLPAFFGAAASGNFYVPIDPALPDRRLAEIYATMKPRVVVTTRRDTRPLPFPDAEIVPLEELLLTPPDGPLLRRIGAEITGEYPLYCIFTSGSTGVPKGVLVSHRSVLNMTEQFIESFGLDHTAVFGNQAPFDFDVSVKDIYLAVRTGARLEILEKPLFSSPGGSLSGWTGGA